MILGFGHWGGVGVGGYRCKAALLGKGVWYIRCGGGGGGCLSKKVGGEKRGPFYLTNGSPLSLLV